MGHGSVRTGASLAYGARRDTLAESEGSLRVAHPCDSICPSFSRSKMVEDVDAAESDFSESVCSALWSIVGTHQCVMTERGKCLIPWSWFSSRTSFCDFSYSEAVKLVAPKCWCCTASWDLNAVLFTLKSETSHGCRRRNGVWILLSSWLWSCSWSVGFEPGVWVLREQPVTYSLRDNSHWTLSATFMQVLRCDRVCFGARSRGVEGASQEPVPLPSRSFPPGALACCMWTHGPQEVVWPVLCQGRLPCLSPCSSDSELDTSMFDTQPLSGGTDPGGFCATSVSSLVWGESSLL